MIRYTLIEFANFIEICDFMRSLKDIENVAIKFSYILNYWFDLRQHQVFTQKTSKAVNLRVPKLILYVVELELENLKLGKS